MGRAKSSCGSRKSPGAAGTSQLGEAEAPAAVPARPEENHANYDVVENNSDEDAAVTDDGLPKIQAANDNSPRRTPPRHRNPLATISTCSGADAVTVGGGLAHGITPSSIPF